MVHDYTAQVSFLFSALDFADCGLHRIKNQVTEKEEDFS